MIYCAIDDLDNESDVEQKLISPIIIGNKGQGLGFLTNEYRSKETTKRLTIDKGQSKKSYRPDFIVYFDGFPAVIIEAKNPSEDLEEGYREARLYANELNAIYPSGINPCIKVIASNGKEFWYGNVDTVSPKGKFTFSDIVVGNSSFDIFLDFCGKESISKDFEKLVHELRSDKQFHKPVAMLGGVAKREEEVVANGFGVTLMNQYQSVFNPQTIEDRGEIVKHAYIASTAIEKHTDPIRKIILATMPHSVSDATQIQDTSKPREIINKIFGKKRITNQLLLIVGNVGSGKTTFMDYLKEVVLSDEVKTNTNWLYVDLNPAPTSKENIYDWLMDKIIYQLKEQHPDLNLNSLDELRKIYAQDIKEFDDGEGELLKGNQDAYNKELFKLIQKLKADKVKTSKSYTKYLCGERSKTLVLVLDNCDKRDRDTQLLMFEVARWAKEEYQAVVFLPMRDVTYDMHRTEPPLDTLVKDMTFRIDPPKLSDVLYRRVSYAMSGFDGELTHTTANGVHFKITKEQQEKYLACILDTLYNGTPLAKSIIDGLAGRDIRRGIEIFISFCKSGHISAERLIKMRMVDGKHGLESHVVMQAFLRGDRRFYSDQNSYIKNLFNSDASDVRPDPFTRLAVLSWLERRKSLKGPSNFKGFHSVSSLINDLKMSGHDEQRVFDEIVFLLRERCILSESQIEETISDMRNDQITSYLKEDSLLKIASAGVIHLEFVKNLTYLAACSEDTWYENQKLSQDIASRISGKIGAGQFSLDTTIANAEDLVQYLIDYRRKFYPNEDILRENNLAYLDLDEIKNFVDDNREKFNNHNELLLKSYPIGTVLEGQIDSHRGYPGAIVILGRKAKGLIREENLNLSQTYAPGMKVQVKITGFDQSRQKFDLDLVV